MDKDDYSDVKDINYVLSLKNYQRRDKILDQMFWKYHNIIKLKSSALYIARESKKTISDFTRNDAIELIREIDIISRINHPSILKFKGYSLLNFKRKMKPIIVMETSKFNLSNISIDTKDITDTKKLIIFYGIASAMSFLHSHNILHRGLYLENIFLDENFYPKLSGFNNSVEIENMNQNYQFVESNVKGYFEYLAPEVLSQMKFSKSSDVYSFAIIMYEIMMNKNIHYFYDNFQKSLSEYVSNVSKQGNRPNFYKNVESCYSDLIKRCWSQEPEKRPSFDQILTELRTNKEFIKHNVDADEFYKYVEFIEKEKMTLAQKNGVNLISKFLHSNKLKIADIELREKDITNPFTDIDLSNYKTRKKINGKNGYDFYIFKNKNDIEINFDERLKKELLNSETETDDETESYDDSEAEEEEEDEFDDEEEENEEEEEEDENEEDEKCVNKNISGILSETDTNDAKKVVESESITGNEKEDSKSIDEEDKNENETKKNQKYIIQIYTKEINCFYRHEIINFVSKMNIVSQVHHPAILNFIGYSPIDFDNKPKPVFLIQRYLENLDDTISFNSRFSQKSDEFDDTMKLIYIYGIASGMAYLHSHDIIHRDLKSSNIYLDQDYLPKIAGLDLAIIAKNESVIKSDKIKGTPAYLAPEIYLNKEYSKSSDVYSFSLLMYEILTGKKAYFEYSNPNELKRAICEENKRPSFDIPVYESYRTLIERCWSRDPSSRPTFDEIVTELKTNPIYITIDVDKKDYFDYVKFIDEFPSTFDSVNRYNQYDKIIETKIHTFADIGSFPILKNMYETELNDLSFNYNYFNLNGIKSWNLAKGHFYSVDKIYNEEKKGITYIAKYPTESFEDTYAGDIINYKRELAIIPQFNHPSILKFIGFNPFYETNERPAFIVEYCSKGSISNYIEGHIHTLEGNDYEKLKLKINDTNKLIWIYGVASGMSYLHSHNILHRDLKTANIFLDDLLNPKISGFNISVEIKNASVKKSDKIKGTPAYLAPEVYLNKEYSKSSDVYSFSLLMYEILTGKKAYFECNSPKELKRAICEENKRPSFDIPVYESYRTLIERCWSRDPSSRPTFDEIVTELKTNPKYITDNIDSEKYKQYIGLIDESKISFDPSNRITQFGSVLINEISSYEENSSKINFRSIYETESNDILFNYDYVNLHNFEKQKLIRILGDENYSKTYKIYKISDKKTGICYTAKKITDRIDDLYPVIYKKKFYREVNNLLELNHPSILKFVGYSPIDFKDRAIPFIISEYGSNGTLDSILELDMKNKYEQILNDTKRLIIIYGIASGMSYLHSHNIVHSGLSTSNVFLDDFLFPKITGFENSDNSSENPIPDILTVSFGSIYYEGSVFIPPEQILFNTKSTSGDVYSFSMILYELITNKLPFDQCNYEVIQNVCENNLRPSFNKSVPECYQKLIEKCWARDPKERPTFDEIVYLLKTESDFITEKVNKEEYENYIKLIDKIQLNKKYVQLSEIMNAVNKTFQQVQINFNKMRNPSKLKFLINMGSINLEDYEKREKIGAGSFGSVYKVFEKENDNIYAAKVSIYPIDQCTNIEIINLIREVDIISRLKHPAILEYIGFNSKNFKSKPKPVIITKYAIGGSLDDIIENGRLSDGNTEWNDTKKLINIYGIASGMAYLHKLNILHRDLKPGNILLDDLLYPKIADFGLSKTIYEEDEIECNRKNPITSGFKGTYAYCSPEILNDNKYTKAGDVYAYGVIVYEIVTNTFPYKGLNQFQILQKMVNGYRPDFKQSVPYCYKKLIQKCWSESESSRPDFNRILLHLENDPNFITPNVDKNEYYDYIEYTKQNENQLFLPKIFQRRKKIINLCLTIDEQMNNDCFLDLSNFDRKEIIYKGDFSKLYKFVDKKTGNIYAGQMSMLKINNIPKDNIDKLSNDLNCILKFDHPSLLKFIGYSPFDFKKQLYPVIVTEFVPNKSLEIILQIERTKKPIQGWDDTKKLINIYGIASGMSYLHWHGIIHRSLKPSNIYLDEILTPKIGDFGLSTRFYDPTSTTQQSISGIKALTAYSAPEILQNGEYNKSCDVYSFAFIVYEIVTNEIPFNEITNSNQIFDEVVIKKNRPKIRESIPDAYKELIEKCWSHDINERPSFDEIIFMLKNDERFITDKIVKNDYIKYTNFIDAQASNRIHCPTIEETEYEINNAQKYKTNTTNKNEVLINKSGKKLIEINAITEKSFDINVNKEKYIVMKANEEKDIEMNVNEEKDIEMNVNEEKNIEKIVNEENDINTKLNEEKDIEIKENEEKDIKIYVNEENEIYVNEENEIYVNEENEINVNEEKYIEMKANEEKNINKIVNEEKDIEINANKKAETVQSITNKKQALAYGTIESKTIKNKVESVSHIEKYNYLKTEAYKGNVQVQEFLAKIYIENNDTENIYNYFCMLLKNGKCEIPLKYATLLYKKKYYKEAFNYFSLISKVNHPVAKYFIGVMKFLGQGCHIDRDEAYKILKYLSENGIDKASEFLNDNFEDK